MTRGCDQNCGAVYKFPLEDRFEIRIWEQKERRRKREKRQISEWVQFIPGGFIVQVMDGEMTGVKFQEKAKDRTVVDLEWVQGKLYR